jgi:hypothetical protein
VLTVFQALHFAGLHGCDQHPPDQPACTRKRAYATHDTQVSTQQHHGARGIAPALQGHTHHQQQTALSIPCASMSRCRAHVLDLLEARVAVSHGLAQLHLV